mmetsp:Transcript_118591/g.330870  ORF Transcript_118591/g.330870 Transcript_118591/m.330870 type:complete len:245 (-) Transcript_118591:499-1233(-)
MRHGGSSNAGPEPEVLCAGLNTCASDDQQRRNLKPSCEANVLGRAAHHNSISARAHYPSLLVDIPVRNITVRVLVGHGSLCVANFLEEAEHLLGLARVCIRTWKREVQLGSVASNTSNPLHCKGYLAAHNSQVAVLKLAICQAVSEGEGRLNCMFVVPTVAHKKTLAVICLQDKAVGLHARVLLLCHPLVILCLGEGHGEFGLGRNCAEEYVYESGAHLFARQEIREDRRHLAPPVRQDRARNG